MARGARAQEFWRIARRPEQPARGSSRPLGLPAAVERRGQPHVAMLTSPETGPQLSRTAGCVLGWASEPTGVVGI